MSSPLDAGQPLLVAAPADWRSACFSLPAVRSLAAAGHPLTLLAPQPQAGLWEAAGAAEVVRYPAGAKSRAIARLLPEAPTVLLWQAGPAAEACRQLATRIGPPDPALARLLSEAVGEPPRPGPPGHQVRGFLELASRLGADPFQAPHFRPLVEAAPPDNSWLLLPDSDFGASHHWPVERWQEVARALLDGGAIVGLGTIAGAPGGQALALARALQLEAIEFELPALAQFAGFQRCLSVENSAVHLAAAAGVTCAVLFGPGDPERHRPLGTQHLPLRRKVECSPCGLARCPLDHRCQLELTVDEVLGKLRPWIAGGA